MRFCSCSLCGVGPVTVVVDRSVLSAHVPDCVSPWAVVLMTVSVPEMDEVLL